jgi:hypothetical protein
MAIYRVGLFPSSMAVPPLAPQDDLDLSATLD